MVSGKLQLQWIAHHPMYLKTRKNKSHLYLSKKGMFLTLVAYGPCHIFRFTACLSILPPIHHNEMGLSSHITRSMKYLSKLTTKSPTHAHIPRRRTRAASPPARPPRQQQPPWSSPQLQQTRRLVVTTHQGPRREPSAEGRAAPAKYSSTSSSRT